MTPKVLGRITTSIERPRGPDVQMSVAVPEDWLVSGATIEVELPRNLACAVCGGGGCDACERAGAVSLRGRKEAAERVEVTLPPPSAGEDPGSSRERVVVMRIPDRGGHPAVGEELPRGNLLLSVHPGPEAGRGVTRLAQPSMPPPPPVEIVSVGPGARSVAPVALGRTPVPLAVVAAIVVAVVAMGLLWWLRR